jgi:hypothetical protein
MRKLPLAAVILIPIIMTACSQGGTSTGMSTPASQGENRSASQPAPVLPGNQPEESVHTRIGFITQEYIDDNIAEIPYIEYEGEQNPEIESINRSLNQGIQREYDEFMTAYTGDRDWIEIRSYPFTTEQYLQVVVTSARFPSYGTDGELFSVNYDKAAGKWLTIDDALTMENLTLDDVLFEVGQLFEPEVETQIIDEVETAGFHIQEDGSIEFLLEITVGNSDGDPWKTFYSYTPQPGGLSRLDRFCLFDPSEMDQLDPPLSYQNQ